MRKINLKSKIYENFNAKVEYKSTHVIKNIHNLNDQNLPQNLKLY